MQNPASPCTEEVRTPSRRSRYKCGHCRDIKRKVSSRQQLSCPCHLRVVLMRQCLPEHRHFDVRDPKNSQRCLECVKAGLPCGPNIRVPRTFIPRRRPPALAPTSIMDIPSTPAFRHSTSASSTDSNPNSLPVFTTVSSHAETSTLSSPVSARVTVGTRGRDGLQRFVQMSLSSLNVCYMLTRNLEQPCSYGSTASCP
jgi:hypothetical protein